MMLKLINCPSMPKSLSFNKAPSGSKKRPLYKYVYDEKYGCPRRVLNGYMDQHAFIQQSKDDVDFKSIGQMLVDNKENIISHFVDRDGEIIDVTGNPRNIHELNKLYNDMHDSFDKLPDDVKAIFGNDFDTFSKAYRSGTLGSQLDDHFKAQQVEEQPTQKEGDK